MSITLTLTVEEYNLAKPFEPQYKVTISDRSTALETLDFSEFKNDWVDCIDATDGVLALSVAEYLALRNVKLNANDVVTLSDTGQNIASLTPTQIQALAGKRIDVIDASDSILTLSVKQLTALGAVTLTGGDYVTLSDTGAALAGLTTEQIAALAGRGVDAITVTGSFALTVAQAAALIATGITFTADANILVADSGAALSSLTADLIAALAEMGVDALDATDGTLTLSLTQYDALGSLTLASGDLVTVSAPGATLGALGPSRLADFAAKGVDVLEARDGALVLTVDQYLALGSVDLSSGDEVTLSDTGAALADLTADQIAALVGKGIDVIDVIGPLALTAAQTSALIATGITFTTGSGISVVDTGDTLSSLTADTMAAWAEKGVKVLDASDDKLTLSLEQLAALGEVELTNGDTVTLSGTGEALSSLTAATLNALADKGIDVIDVTGSLTLTAIQAAALATTSITFAEGDTVTIADTGEALAKLSAEEMAALAAKGITIGPVTDGPLTLSVEQYRALGAAVPTVDGGIILTDTGAELATLTTDEIGALAGRGVITINADDDALALSVEQFLALGAVNLTSGDAVTLSDTGAALGNLSAAELMNLADKGIDRLDASDRDLNLSVAQFEALGAVTLADDDVITLRSYESYILPANVSHLGLLGEAVAGTGNNLGNFLWGNEANNVLLGLSGDDDLFGFSGNDRLDGGTGIDWIEGGSGNDIYYVDTAGDQVIEAAGQGTDTVYASVSYTLGASAAVETLRTTSTAGNTAINLTGNSFANTLRGNAGANKLNGKGGADTMSGYSGNDTYYVDRAGDKVKEVSSGGTADRVYTTVSHTLALNVENLLASGTASISLTGNKQSNKIYGNTGANKINGGYGNDILKGGLGKDAFIFNTKLSATANVDRITDFSVKDDSLYLDNAIFTKLGSGSMSSPKKLSSSFFTVGSAAKDAHDHVIYNNKTGHLSYDADGSGAGNAVLVAKLAPGLSLTNSDVYII